MRDKKPIHILFICHDGKMYGAQNSLRLLVENLPADQYRVFVSFSKGGELAEVFAAMPHVTVLYHCRIQSAKHTRRSLFQQFGDLFAFVLNLKRTWPLAKTILKNQIDIVHTNSLVSLEGALAAKLVRVPHIWHIRERFGKDNDRFNLILGEKLMKSIIHHYSSRVICISQFVQNQFSPWLQKMPKHYPIVYNAIAETAIQPITHIATDSRLMCLYTGRISDGKRFQDLLEAVCLLKTKYGDAMPICVKVYGDFICDKFESYVKTRIEEVGISEDIKLMGYESNLSICYQNIDLLIMPSSNEAFGRTMLDAMVRGVPAVVPNAGGACEVVEEGKSGFFYEADNPQALANCLETVSQKKQILPSMASSCRERVGHLFSVTHQVETMQKIYTEVIAESMGLRNTSSSIKSEMADSIPITSREG